MGESEKHWREFRRTDPAAKAELSRKLAIDYSGRNHPNIGIIIGMRHAYLRRGVTPEEMMKAWLRDTQVEGMKRLPIPRITPEYKSLFHRLVMERDEAKDLRLRDALWVAINVLAIEAIDPEWRGKRLLDLRWPNHIDIDFFRHDGECRSVLSYARGQDSYRIIYGND